MVSQPRLHLTQNDQISRQRFAASTQKETREASAIVSGGKRHHWRCCSAHCIWKSNEADGLWDPLCLFCQNCSSSLKCGAMQQTRRAIQQQPQLLSLLWWQFGTVVARMKCRLAVLLPPYYITWLWFVIKVKSVIKMPFKVKYGAYIWSVIYCGDSLGIPASIFSMN